MEWQDAKTGPRDGTHVLLAILRADYPLVGRWSIHHHCWVKSGDEDKIFPQPEFWHPLPDLPR